MKGLVQLNQRQARGGSRGPLIIVAAIAGLLLLLSQFRNGGGGGPATPGASIGSVTVAQTVTLGLNKTVGDAVFFDFTLNFQTEDFQGNLIIWDYDWIMRLHNAAGGALVAEQFIQRNTEPPGPFTSSGFVILPSSAAGLTLNATLTLRAAISDSQGNPTSPMMDVDAVQVGEQVFVA